MRKWKTDKIVEAEPIEGVRFSKFDSLAQVAVSGAWIAVSPDFVARGTPAVGDYFVRLRTGYLSWSPRRKFEENYRLVLEDKHDV